VLTILCLASYVKGHEFMRECKRQGCHVILLTIEKHAQANWPHESIDELLTLPDLADRQSVIRAVSRRTRTRHIDRVVALEDYDVETAATLREHLRCPGMGDTTARYFRDKLAMRVEARDNGILVPEFVPVLNHERIHNFTQRVPPPWVLKPRSEAAASGIRRIYHAGELWAALDSLGDLQSFFVLEQYIRGDVYHVDSISYRREVLFAESHRYATPPLNVAHDGGLFISSTLQRESQEARTLRRLNREVLGALGFVRGVSHTEFIKGSDDGQFYFLETAARVGGAYLVELIQASTGLNMWAEWAKVEIAGGEQPYALPAHRQDYAGIIISLARQEHPDTSAYDDPEVVWRLDEKHHAGLVVMAQQPGRVQTLLDQYGPRFYQDFFAVQPPLDKPAS
jgi:biotin carboxylase